jgi:hypothetical protein
MSSPMPSLAPLPIPSGLPSAGAVPAWVRVVDALAVVLILVGLSAVITGGFRTDIAGVRVSITSWWRPIAVAALLLLVRHAARRRPTIAERAREGWTAWRHDPIAGAIGPMVIASRVGVLVVGLMATHAIGFPEGRAPFRVAASEAGNLPARYDAGWYLQLATYGYEYLPNRFDRQQNLVFFPAFPVLMSLASLLVARQTLWAGTLLSMVAFAWAARYLYRLARDLMDADRAQTAVLLTCLYPFALFYSAAYTESLFLLAMLGAWYHLRRDERWPAFAWGLLAGLTRPNGCLLSIPLALLVLTPLWRGGRLQRPAGGWASLTDRLVVAAAPGFGMLLYSAWVYDLTGDPFMWIRLQVAWGRQNVGVASFLAGEWVSVGEQGMYQYVSRNVPDFLNILAATLVTVGFVPILRRFGPAPAALLVLNLVPSLASGGWLSVGRATAVLFPTFLWLADAIPARQRLIWYVVFAGLQAFAAVLFFTWRPLF